MAQSDNIIMQASIQVKGLDKVLKTLNKLGNADQIFDTALRQTASNSISELQRESLSKNPMIKGINTGTTARSWTNPFKVTKGWYRTTNNYRTQDEKHLIVDLIDKGHGEIKPSKQFLYIPLNKKAAMKPLGADIPKEFKRGEDYVFARSVSAKKGSDFIEKNRVKYSRELTQRIITAIRAAVKGGV